MKMKWIALSWMIVLSLVAAACSPAAQAPQVMEEPVAESAMEKETPMAGDTSGEDMQPEAADDMMKAEDESDAAGMDDDEMNAESEAQSMRDSPDWFKAEMVNVSSGETFRMDDFHGKVVLVETMAMWCSNCLKQQQQVKALHDLLGERDDFVSVGLDIDINEDAAMLAKYVERNGFDWVYTVVPAEVGRELGNLYGSQFLNPPATPMMIIDANGQVHPLPFGIKSAEKLLEALEPFLNDSM
jgi:adenosyl cobinamide kinase/adenosyl cobinamide phosphate guanylyltransferase